MLVLTREGVGCLADEGRRRRCHHLTEPWQASDPGGVLRPAAVLFGGPRRPPALRCDGSGTAENPLTGCAGQRILLNSFMRLPGSSRRHHALCRRRHQSSWRPTPGRLEPSSVQVVQALTRGLGPLNRGRTQLRPLGPPGGSG